jgi:DNA-binding beta-propeller fold protein YncE
MRLVGIALATVVAVSTSLCLGADETTTSPTPPLVLTQTIALPNVTGGFNHHSADGKTHRLFLCATTNKSIEVVDLNTGKVIKSIVGEKPSATCFAPDLNVLAVSTGKTVQLYDATSFESIAALSMPASIDELRYDARTQQILAGTMTAPHEGVTPIDVAQRKVLDELPLPAQPQGLCVEDRGSRVFANTPRLNQVSVVDRQHPTAAQAWKLADAQGNYPIAYDSATHRLFVGCRNPARLVVLDADTGRSVTAVDCGTGTDDLSFDATNKRIYIACSEGVISVIQQDDADHYRNIATVKTVAGARNCVFVPEASEFAVTVPEGPDQKAEVLVYKAQPSKP